MGPATPSRPARRPPRALLPHPRRRAFLTPTKSDPNKKGVHAGRLSACEIAQSSAHVDLQLLAAVFLAEFAERLFLDLTHPLARQAETLADFFQRERMLAADAEVEADDFGLARVQRGKSPLDVDLERLLHEPFVRSRVLLVGQDVEQAVVVVV